MNFYHRSIMILMIVSITIFSFHASFGEKKDQEKLTGILKKSGEYCKKLENAALDFVCKEKIIEKIDVSDEWAGRDRVLRIVKDLPGAWQPSKKIKENTFMYDYQLIKKNKKVKETRILLEENGKKKYEKNSEIKTEMFYFEKSLFGPIGLLSEYWQDYHHYKIIGEEILDAEKVIIIEAIPKSSLELRHLYGKIWAKESDFSILKIEWEPESMKNYEIIKKVAEKYKATPKITLISEYKVEKNGIRFPSKVFIYEAYISKRGKFIKSETTIIYEDYKFFTVEIEIKY
jgi:hypothetical protein